MRSEKGYSLIETLAGMFILVLVGTALLASLTLSSKVLLDTDTRETARDLAVAEMEYIKHLSYASTYSHDDSLIPEGSGYSVIVNTPVPLEEDENIQLIKVTVWQNGKQVVWLEDYKVNWQ